MFQIVPKKNKIVACPGQRLNSYRMNNKKGRYKCELVPALIFVRPVDASNY